MADIRPSKIPDDDGENILIPEYEDDSLEAGMEGGRHWVKSISFFYFLIKSPQENLLPSAQSGERGRHKRMLLPQFQPAAYPDENLYHFLYFKL